MPAPAAPRRRLDTLNKSSIGVPKSKTTNRPVLAKCCDSPKIEDDGEGKKVCTSCFTLISESNIVADVTFSEDSRGAATVQGGFIGENARHARTLGASAFRRVGGGERNTFAEIENNGRRVLQQLCPGLNISDVVQGQAASIWGLAAKNNFNAGRKTEEVVAACLYAACRRQRRNDKMMIDISEKIHTNVFRLGKVYKDLCDCLFLGGDELGTQYQVEIEPLIEKYCRKLEFGEYTRQVAEDAIKIIRRMNRDWMTQGRHPAGLCGACIILAARMNNFRRSVREVVWVAKIADATVAKRIQEFRSTKAAALTVEQFRKFGPRIREQADPPSIIESEKQKQKFEDKKRKRQESREASMSQTPALEGEDQANKRRRLSDNEPEGEQTIQEGEPGPSTGKRKRTGPDTIEISDGEESDSSVESQTVRPGQSSQEGPRKKKQKKTAGPATNLQEPRIDQDGFVIPPLPASLLNPAGSEEPTPKKRGRKRKEAPGPAPVYTEEELISEEQLEREIEANFEENEVVRDVAAQIDATTVEERAKAMAERQRKYEAEATSARRVAEDRSWYNEEHPNRSREEYTAADLEDEFANDPEVENCLLSPEEAKRKEQIWLTYNEDWVRAQTEKDIQKQLDATTNNANDKNKRKKGANGGKKKRKRSRMGDGSLLEEATTPIESPADATMAMLSKHADAAFSKYIDYDRLASAYSRRKRKEMAVGSGSEGQSRDVSVTPSVASQEGTPAPENAEQQREGDVEPATVAGAEVEGESAATPPVTGWDDAEPEEEDDGAREEEDYNYAIDEMNGTGYNDEEFEGEYGDDQEYE